MRKLHCLRFCIPLKEATTVTAIRQIEIAAPIAVNSSVPNNGSGQSDKAEAVPAMIAADLLRSFFNMMEMISKRSRMQVITAVISGKIFAYPYGVRLKYE